MNSKTIQGSLMERSNVIVNYLDRYPHGSKRLDMVDSDCRTSRCRIDHATLGVIIRVVKGCRPGQGHDGGAPRGYDAGTCRSMFQSGSVVRNSPTNGHTSGKAPHPGIRHASTQDTCGGLESQIWPS